MSQLHQELLRRRSKGKSNIIIQFVTITILIKKTNKKLQPFPFNGHYRNANSLNTKFKLLKVNIPFFNFYILAFTELGCIIT